MADPVESYLRELHEIRSSGAAVKETSYYPALVNLLNEVGRGLKPRVRCLLSLQNRGAGLPDGGLFTPEQFQKGSGEKPLSGQLPSRGAIEVKGTADSLAVLVDGDQVSRYCQRYGLVLATNLRQFALVGRGEDGNPLRLESFSIAETEAAFWTAAAHPRRTVDRLGVRLLEYLRRAIMHAAPLASPQDVAWFLASYARDARARIEGVKLPALNALRSSLEGSLGIRFEGEKGDHFFRSTLVQTLFYGVFAAWVLWSRDQRPKSATGGFDWLKAVWWLRVPMIRALFEQVATPTRLKPLGLVELLNWAGDALNRVDRSAFFARFDEGHAVQYFYEPFLEAFDPELRKQLGVWYTPPEIVRYMVARVDSVLRRELRIADGLADPRVHVLDPCCGTGAYLVEVLRSIGTTLKAKGGDALLADDLKEAAKGRVFGFEILPAPFVVAHLQLGLLLQTLGVPLSEEKSERAGVYLTNALTGWEPPDADKEKVVQLRLEGMPELMDERDAAERVKRTAPILVILGNPPYNGFAGMAVDEERALSNAYRTTKRAPAPQGQGLNDLYVRFFRMAERRIVEHGGEGVVCFISNYSWLDGLSFTGMRERYLDAFDRIWIDCLNGDKYRTGKLTPEGDPDPSVFSADLNPEGIQVGTAISLLVRKKSHQGTAAVAFRHWWGKSKRADLEDSLGASGPPFEDVTPAPELGLPFFAAGYDAEYLMWPTLPELFPASFPGVKTSRDDVVVDIDRDRLVQRMQQYFDPGISHEEMRRIEPRAMESSPAFDAAATREYLCRRGFLPTNVVRYHYRPFDVRWLYWESDGKLLDRNRAEYFPHVDLRNIWLVSQQKPRRTWSAPQIASSIGCIDLMDRSASFIPLYLHSTQRCATLFDELDVDTSRGSSNGLLPNRSEALLRYARHVEETQTADLPFYHTVAAMHAPRYLMDNAGALRQDWPRIPLPEGIEQLLASAALGRRLAALLDSEHPVAGITEGAIRPEMAPLARASRVDGGGLNVDTDLVVTAGWGHAGLGGVTMPGQGRLAARGYSPDENAAMAAGAEALGLSPEQALGLLGEGTIDVYLNPVAYWSNVPSRVWGYTIGGYQVLKKWLSYRESDILGRPLRKDEVREFTNIARRIAAILLMEPTLDANYRAVKAATYPWRGNRR